MTRWPWPFWGGGLLLVLLASIFGRPDIPIDETRYVSVAWEMWSGGDWLVMHKNGELYHHKPPLLFWFINLGWLLFGVNDWWPRSISALFSFSSLGLTVAIARRLWPHEEGVGERAGWILLGGCFWLFFSTSVIFDIMLTAFALLALLAALRSWQGERWGTWGCFGLALGLGILAKGPVMFLHVLPVLLLESWWGRGGRLNKAWYGDLGLGFLLGVAIALAWAIPAAIAGGEEFRNAIFWNQTAGRISGALAHRQPFWFYLAILPILLFPWFFWGRAWSAMGIALKRRGEVGVRFCLAWIVPALLVFSLSGGKQAHYILPLLPAFALLLAFGWDRTMLCGRRSILPLFIVIAGMGIVFLLPQAWADRMWLASFVGSEWFVGGAFLLVLAISALFLAGSDMKLPWVTLGMAAMVAGIQLLILKPLSSAFDMIPMAQRLKALEERGIPVAHTGAYNNQYQFYGRLRHPLQEIRRDEINTWLQKNPAGRVVTYLKQGREHGLVNVEFSQPYLDGTVILLDAESAQYWQGREP